MTRNVALRLALQANASPDQIAIATPLGSARKKTLRPYGFLSFRDLEERSSAIAAGLQAMGMQPGQRIVLLVRFGEDFITLVFALLKVGVTLVLIDPGMGRKHVLRCLAETRPDGFVAIPQAHIIRQLYRHHFPAARLNVTVGRRFGLCPAPTLRELERHSPTAYREVVRHDQDPAAIIFTTGSTGPPKGVLYTHGTFNHQIDQLVERYAIEPGGTDLSCFPLFGLFNAVMGTTTILPDMNPIRPADVDPPRLLDAIDQWAITQSFGSPALWTAVGSYCQRTGRRVPSLRRLLSAGAPVSPRILRWMREAMDPEGTMHTPYGATEALPIASIESREVLEETAERAERGEGTCVGRSFSGVEWRVIEISDAPIATIDQTRMVRPGQVGELIVSGPVVSREYVTRTDQNAFHKISDGLRFWHRMGDVGYLDDQDRFWYCGRKSHRVVTPHRVLFTDPCEAVINTHPAVYRSALIGIEREGVQRPVVLVEPWATQRPKPGSPSEASLCQSLRDLAKSNEVTRSIDEIRIFPRRLPTDIRHNSKIFREQLVPWYEKHGASKEKS